jgi:hypothetical protein
MQAVTVLTRLPPSPRPLRAVELLCKDQGRGGDKMARVISAVMIVSVVFFASVAASAGDTVQNSTGSGVAAAGTGARDALVLRRSGEQLRRQLTTVYKELDSHSREIPNHPDSRDITETVIEFLPVGISLNDAESILRFAGFSIHPVDLREWDGSRSPILARASIYPFERHFLYTYYSSIDVELYQDIVDQRDRVGRLRAKVVTPSL